MQLAEHCTTARLQAAAQDTSLLLEVGALQTRDDVVSAVVSLLAAASPAGPALGP